MIKCGKCGFQNNDDANFCSRCGNRLEREDRADTTLAYSVTVEDSTEESPFAAPGDELPMLVIRAGGGREGERILLDADLVTVGRNPDSHIFLDDVTVSRHHARIVRDATGYVIEDLNSLNGTYVNRHRVERHHLSDGDELQVGKFKLAFLEPSLE